jgi:tagatose-6-phosphate ketose/aldose isomerase
LLVSFSRSGRSPESFEVIRIGAERYPGYRQLLVTCNGDGELIHLFSSTANFDFVALHPASCDQGLAMTSSFSSMVLCGQILASLGDPRAYLEGARRLASLGRALLPSCLDLVQSMPLDEIRRVCVLGNGALNGAAAEGALKVLEMTDGQIATLAETFLGVRHGPLSFVDESSLAVFLISGQGLRRRYERDLMTEVKAKGLGRYRVAMGYQIAPEERELVDAVIDLSEYSADVIADDLLPPAAVILPQLLALQLSLNAGLDPDNPSRRGAINRVVEGVTIHRH